MVERVYREPTVTVSAREHTSHSIALVGKLSKALRCFISVLRLRDPNFSQTSFHSVWGFKLYHRGANPSGSGHWPGSKFLKDRWIQPGCPRRSGQKKERFRRRNAFAKRSNHKLSHVWLPFAVNAANMYYSSTNHLLPWEGELTSLI
jgi:hypothetical protein